MLINIIEKIVAVVFVIAFFKEFGRGCIVHSPDRKLTTLKVIATCMFILGVIQTIEYFDIPSKF